VEGLASEPGQRSWTATWRLVQPGAPWARTVLGPATSASATSGRGPTLTWRLDVGTLRWEW